MILITGDTHGTIDISKVQKFFKGKESRFTKDDYLIILGDVGVCWDGGSSDQQVKSVLSSLPVTTLFIDGNHENHPLLNSYPEVKWHGGMVHEIAPDILHLMRGYVFNIQGYKFLALGGASSTDRTYRIEGVSWWPEELPDEEEMERAETSLSKVGWKVDYVLTHTAPYDVVSELNVEMYEPEMDFQYSLQRIADQLDFRKWLFGHHHIDEKIDEQFIAVYNKFLGLKGKK